MEKINTVFIGGTGRSGTTILAKVLGAHSGFLVLPIEIRFITDPDGLISLKANLVDYWSHHNADVSIVRFKELMKNLKTRYIGTYPNSNLGELFGEKLYDKSLEMFLNDLCAFKYKGAWAGRTNTFEKVLLRYLPFKRESYGSLIKDVYYQSFLSEEKFFEISRNFLTNLFGGKLSSIGKTHFVDHTPTNLIHADFLVKLFPDMKLLHIFRDPRDVVSSYCKKDWAPTNVEYSAQIVKDILDRWRFIKTKVPKNNYMEIRFEDFIENSKQSIDEICKFIGINPQDSMYSVDLSKHNIGRWKKDLTKEQIDIINKKFNLSD